MAHAALSAPFVDNPSVLDAAMLLSQVAAPAALQMAAASQRFGNMPQSNESAYNIALNTTRPFHSAREKSPKLYRQCSAYLHYAGGLHAIDNVTNIFAQLNWTDFGNNNARCSIVEVCQSHFVA